MVLLTARTSRLPTRLWTLALSVTVLLMVAPGCSLKRVALGSIANALSGSGTTFASDEDPELIRGAVPFSLKTMESLLEELPNHAGLLLATCSGFTQYGYAFVETDAAQLEQTDFERSRAEKDRARKLYVRARNYCLRHLELKHPGIGRQLATAPDAAMPSPSRKPSYISRSISDPTNYRTLIYCYSYLTFHKYRVIICPVGICISSDLKSSLH